MIKGEFSFELVDFQDIKAEILKLKTNVSCPSGSISSSLLKDNLEVSTEFLGSIINFGIRTNSFDDNMKFADITPVHKKDDTILKGNYRPISCLPAG